MIRSTQSFPKEISKSLLLFVLYFSFFTVLFVSCEPNVENLDLPVQQKYIVLECYLTPGYPPELTLTQSNTLEDELVIRNLWYADVSLDIDGMVYPMKNMIYTKPDRRILVNYRANDTLRTSGHDQFNLSVTTRQQEKLNATTGTVDPIYITDYHIADSRIDVGYKVEGGKADWLKMGVALFVDKKMTPYIQYFDTKQQVEGKATMLWKRPATTIDSIAITVFNIQKDYYDYGTSLQNAVNAYHDPLMMPETIKSNIDGGIGIFTYYTFDRVMVRYD